MTVIRLDFLRMMKKFQKLQVGFILFYAVYILYIPSLFHFMFHTRSWQKHRQRKMRMGMDVVLQFAYYQQHQQLSKSNMKSKWSKIITIQTFLVSYVFVWFHVEWCVSRQLGWRRRVAPYVNRRINWYCEDIKRSQPAVYTERSMENSGGKDEKVSSIYGGQDQIMNAEDNI